MTFTPHMTHQQTPDASGGEDTLVPGTSVPISHFSLPQGVADRIGKLVLDRYTQLMEGHGQHSRRKVLAGIVMTRDDDMDQMEVISVSTGTKCVNGEHMSVGGNAVNGKNSKIACQKYESPLGNGLSRLQSWRQNLKPPSSPTFPFRFRHQSFQFSAGGMGTKPFLTR